MWPRRRPSERAQAESIYVVSRCGLLRTDPYCHRIRWGTRGAVTGTMMWNHERTSEVGSWGCGPGGEVWPRKWSVAPEGGCGPGGWVWPRRRPSERAKAESI